MVRPESGTVTMLGKDFYANEKECKQDIGVVFGGIDFYPLKKLSAITAVTRRFYNDYLRQFSLDENKQFRSLSNGMKVKYLLALALSHHATLYLLDEPTSGLDPVSRDEILHIFTRIVKDGKRSVLFSTHITSDLDRCADDITYIQNGKVLQSADKDTFLHSFEHLKTAEDTSPLTLEEIMLRTEGRTLDETALKRTDACRTSHIYCLCLFGMSCGRAGISLYCDLHVRLLSSLYYFPLCQGNQ